MTRRPLHLGGAARYKSESQRPDLWPMYAWNPMMGITGGTLLDLSENKKNAACSSPVWSATKFGPATSHDGTSAKMFSTGNNSYSWYSPWTAMIIATPSNATNGQVAFSCYDESNRDGGWTIWYDIDGDYDGWSFCFCRRVGALRYYRLAGKNTLSGAVGVPSIIIAGYTGGTSGSWFLWVDGVQITESVTVSGDPLYPGEMTCPITIGGRYKGSTTSHFLNGTVNLANLFPVALSASQILSLHADPLLPFRRKTFVSLYVPSGGPAGLAHNIFGSPVFGKLVG